MKSAVLALVALALGIVAGSWIVRYPAVHRVTGRIFQRGELLALAGQRGIFEADVQARAQQKQYCSGMTDKPLDSTEKIAVRDEVIASETLRVVAGKLDDSDVAGEVADLEHQFGDERQVRAALGRSDVSQSELGRLVAETIGGERWIEKQIAPRLAVSDAEVQQYFQQHEAQFTQPLRIRARHIFLAAPEGSAPDVAEAKDRQMLDIAARLGQGEDFGELAATVSEDEASKRMVATSAFSRPTVSRWNFLTPLQSCSPMALRVFCARLWVFMRSNPPMPIRLAYWRLQKLPPRSEHYLPQRNGAMPWPR